MPPLPAQSRSITIAQRSSKKIGYRIGRTTRWITINQLESAGVRLMRGATLQRTDSAHVLFGTPHGTERIAARTLVVATGQEPACLEILPALTKAGVAWTMIGAAASTLSAPASISSSMKSGHRFAMNLTVIT